jgi:hypothetical protein
MSKLGGCVFCSYVVDAGAVRNGKRGGFDRVPDAVEIIETPNGPRALCAEHARYVVRKGDPEPEGTVS